MKGRGLSDDKKQEREQEQEREHEHLYILGAAPEARRAPLPRMYWPLLLVRLLIAVAPHSSYVHPDEFFQSVEPMVGDVFDVDSVRSWEFNASFPIRSTVVLRATVGFPLVCLRGLAYYLSGGGERTVSPYAVMTVIRLAHFAMSLVNDYCMYRMCILYGQNAGWRLVVLAGSWPMLVYATRALSNGAETALASMLLLLAVECALRSERVGSHEEFLARKRDGSESVAERVRYLKLLKSLPAHSLAECFPVATIAVVGTFARPTFVAFAFPIVFFWLVRGIGVGLGERRRRVGMRRFHERIFALVACAVPALTVVILTDSAYYGYLTAGEIGVLAISMDNFVVTPLNFLKYNANPENLARHGLHPRWLHLAVNVPLLFNVLGIVAILFGCVVFVRVLRGISKTAPKIRTVNGLMFFSFLIPLMVLSFFPHQEPRFLLPLLIPLVFSFGSYLRKNDGDTVSMSRLKNIGLSIWILCNVSLTLFFGVLHQGGVFHAVKHFHSELKSKPRGTALHLITSHVYDVPRSLLLTENTNRLRMNPVTGHKYYLSKQIYFYELRSAPVEDVVRKARVVWNASRARFESERRNYRIYVAIPSPLSDDLHRAWHRANFTDLELIPERLFYPHWSAEAAPSFPNANDIHCVRSDNFYESEINFSQRVELSMLDRMICYFKQYTLQLYKIDRPFLKRYAKV